MSQYFSVLEDGALAHNLQEQEIEQHYSSNVQRNQLVQKDIRVAKRLQDEEKQRAQMLHEQATRQLEAQDSEYARKIQEEILHAADEERKREERDEEIAKRIQEEEELYVRQRTSCRRIDSREKSSTIRSTNVHQPSRPLFIEEEELVWHSQAHSPSLSPSDSEAEHYEHRRSFSREYSDNAEQRRQPVRELPLRRRSGQSRNSCTSQSSAPGNLQGGWSDVVRLIKNDLSEQGYLSYSSEDEIFEPVYELERIFSRRQQCGKRGTRLSHHSSMREANGRKWQGDRVNQMDRYRHSEYKDSRCVRSESRLVRDYSDYKSGDGQRRVRFLDDQNRDSFYIDSRTSFDQRPSENRNLRSYNVRPYHSNVHIDRILTGKLNEAHRQEAYGMRNCLSQEIKEEDHGRFRERGSWEGGSRRGRVEQRPRAHSARVEAGSRRYHGELGRRCIGSDRWPGHQEDRSSSEGEDVERERERRRLETQVPRQPQRSLSASFTGRSAGAGQSVNRPSLDLGELRQVLQDEELARRLQAEEEELLRGDLATATLERSYPEGDFTVAQVAQDEEIAHFIQKQEITSQLQSRELEDCGSVRGNREMSHVCDNREGCDGQMPRERLNSEGLVSPRDECFLENQLSSPVSLAMQQHPFRNVAEELDPTFQRKGSMQAGQSTSDTCLVQTTPQAGSCEEPTFVAPTKRQNDKPGRAKSKEKKENTKSKENCKQQ
ncbi:coiled-coil domain-containing protein 187 isoform 2-T3 [Clarias gariepinus]